MHAIEAMHDQVEQTEEAQKGKRPVQSASIIITGVKLREKCNYKESVIIGESRGHRPLNTRGFGGGSP